MTGRGRRGLLHVASPFMSTHSFWTLPAVQMTRNVCWGNWSLREAAGRSQSWEHWVKEMPSHTTFLTVEPQPCPSPHYAPPILGYPDRAGPVPAIWSPPLHSQR